MRNLWRVSNRRRPDDLRHLTANLLVHVGRNPDHFTDAYWCLTDCPGAGINEVVRLVGQRRIKVTHLIIDRTVEHIGMRPQEPRRQRRFKRIEDTFLLVGDAEFFTYAAAGTLERLT